MDYAKESLRLHGEWKGKIEVVATVPVETKDDLSLAYTPGVAQPCLEIQKDVNKSYDLTRRWNTVAAAYALAGLVSEEELNPDYILPAAFDPRVKDAVAAAVAEAARKSGVARI